MKIRAQPIWNLPEASEIISLVFSIYHVQCFGGFQGSLMDDSEVMFYCYFSVFHFSPSPYAKQSMQAKISFSINSIYNFTMLIMICTTITTFNSPVVSDLSPFKNCFKISSSFFWAQSPEMDFQVETPTTLRKPWGCDRYVQRRIIPPRLSFWLTRCACFSTHPFSVIIYIGSFQSYSETGITGSKVSYIIPVAVFLRNWKP